MREILFRGKRIDNGEWVYGFYAAEPNGRKGDGVVHLIQPLNDNGRFDILRRVDPETVGQYTGLTDQNGTKIFEGDICRVTRLCVLEYGKITFKNGCFWFESFGVAGMLRMCDISINGFNIEIYGNIYDNPELLTEERT